MNDPILGFDGEYRWLSNFYPLENPIIYEDISFPTTEHIYQAMKCVHTEDMKYISQLSPGQAKRVGRIVAKVDDWDACKYDVMYYILVIKYNQPKFKKLLLATGDRYIEETNNWHDNFYGNCICEKCTMIEGQNNLGKIIMKIRDTLK